MGVLKSFLIVSNLATLVGLSTLPVAAETTKYPLTLENCGSQVTYHNAPERAVGLGQNSAEIMLLLDLEDKMVGTAFWPNNVLPQVAEANAKVKVLTVEFPTFESILAENPDFVAAALPSLVGPASKVAKREDFEKISIPTYISPSTCVTEGGKHDKFGYGDRSTLWNMDTLFKEIEDIAQIFDVADKRQAVIADLKKREAVLRADAPEKGKDLTYLFWFSSSAPSADAYVGGKNTASGFIADVLGGTNAISNEAESPAIGWESIIASNPDVIVVTQVDRNRWELDNAQEKIKFLNSDPATSQMKAVKNKALVIMPAQAMNPSVQTIYGAEQVAQQLKALGLK
ncbi:ABC transporter substrate-binding protein [Brucella sp. BE17]|uniref:ABC transporter substrate-binding protein n=1 Tax=Brucella sp. BE17 TaxID=3142977 RepID=UPI0031BB5648